MINRNESAVVVPTDRQKQWAECEIGVIIHLDLSTFDPMYKQHCSEGIRALPESFAPDRLDTDSWLEAAKSAGAKYAILTVKHCSGFSLYPTKVNDYCIGSRGQSGKLPCCQRGHYLR